MPFLEREVGVQSLEEAERRRIESLKEIEQEEQAVYTQNLRSLATGERLIASLRDQSAELQATTTQQKIALEIKRRTVGLDREQAQSVRELVRANILLRESIQAKAEADRAAAQAIRDAQRRIDNFANSLTSNLSSAFNRAIFAGEGFRSTMQGLLQDLAQLILRITVLRPLAESLVQVFSRQPSGGGFFAQLLGSVLGGFGGSAAGGGGGGVVQEQGGFQHGGAFTVPGSGAPDSRQLFLRATPGERVTIETPEQQRRGRGDGSPVSVVVNNYASRDTDVDVSTGSGPSGERLLEVMVFKSVERLSDRGTLDPVFSRYGSAAQLDPAIMALSTWPSSLPERFEPQGFSLQPVSQTIETPVDVGPVRLRRRSSLSVVRIKWLSAVGFRTERYFHYVLHADIARRFTVI